MCNGNIYYTTGKKDGKMLNFTEAINLDDQWTVNFVNGSANGAKCEHATFENTDPVKGNRKQCFCDDDRKHTTPLEIETVKEYWRQKKIQAELEEEERQRKIKEAEEKKRREEQEKRRQEEKARRQKEEEERKKR